MRNKIGERIVLGIETSCDETAVALVDEQGTVLSDEVLSQTEHSSFGGVVPELAARRHFDSLHILVERALHTAGKNLEEIDAVAVTTGPGLIGSLIVGVMFAKAICYATKKPIIPVNHLEAHVLISRIKEKIEFPFLALIISGGHCQLVLAMDVGSYKSWLLEGILTLYTF